MLLLPQNDEIDSFEDFDIVNEEIPAMSHSLRKPRRDFRLQTSDFRVRTSDSKLNLLGEISL